MRQLLEEGPGGEGLASEKTLQILRRVTTGPASVLACADTIVEEAAGSAPSVMPPSYLVAPPTRYLNLDSEPRSSSPFTVYPETLHSLITGHTYTLHSRIPEPFTDAPVHFTLACYMAPIDFILTCPNRSDLVLKSDEVQIGRRIGAGAFGAGSYVFREHSILVRAHTHTHTHTHTLCVCVLSVYAGTLGAGTPVALKEAFAGAGRGGDDGEQEPSTNEVIQECKVLHRLRHPNITQLYGLWRGYDNTLTLTLTPYLDPNPIT